MNTIFFLTVFHFYFNDILSLIKFNDIFLVQTFYLPVIIKDEDVFVGALIAIGDFNTQ